ncbi:hypothetical protein, partial [Microbispora triticiradicis]|uniref:hypothetical protein n=1 Tax=Microbispora triticiradicis TaxID=2200763 RepID=UPI001AD7DDD9
AAPGNPVYTSYLLDAPTPPDARFSQSTAPGRTAPPSGAAALRDWLDHRLVPPKNVTVVAHASYEGDSSPATTALNQRLSERRLAVARGVIANRATIVAGEAKGFSRAQAAGRVGHDEDRVVEITGKVQGADPAVSIQAVLARPAAPV